MIAANRTALAIALLLAAGLPARGVAQELNPRAYWPAPTGTTVLIAAYQYSEGEVLFDPTLAVEDARSSVNVAQVGARHSFGLLGRTATAELALPASWGTTDGLVAGEPRRRDMSGLADVTARISVNLTGAPAMTPAQFRQLAADPGTIVGASFAVTSPTGRYDEDRFLNIGANRWAFRPAVGIIQPLGKGWILEGEVGASFFTANHDFVGSTRSQAALFSTQVHLVKALRNGLWVAIDGTYYTGGRTAVDGEASFDLQRNSRVGATFLYPFGSERQHALRLGLSTGLFTERGGDFDSVSVAYLRLLR